MQLGGKSNSSTISFHNFLQETSSAPPLFITALNNFNKFNSLPPIYGIFKLGTFHDAKN